MLAIKSIRVTLEVLLTFCLDILRLQQLGSESRQKNKTVAHKFGTKKSGERRKDSLLWSPYACSRD